MKRIIAVSFIIMVMVTTVGCSSQKDNETAENILMEQEQSAAADFGAKSAFEKVDLNIEEMLRYAIQDEYLARQEYELIIEEYGEQRPFINIIKAEEYHIEMLKEIYETYGYEVPVDNAIEHTVLPESLEEAFDIGVQAEIDNIAMYEMFLENELPNDIHDVFIVLRDGSKNHLAAFEKGVRGGGRGN